MRALVIGAVVAAGGLAASSAYAAEGGIGRTITLAFHQHGTFEDDGAANPCTGEPGAAIFDGNSTEHETFFPNSGTGSGTFTETGKVTFTTDGVTFYTGHAKAWGNFHLNRQTSTSTFTLTIHASAPDGSSIDGHEVAHFTLNPNGVITVNFDRPSFTCG